MDKIIFLDIDGVLNDRETFKNNHGILKCFYKINSLKTIKDKKDYAKMLVFTKIDFNKVSILKTICNFTGAKVVVTSSWRKLNIYPFIEKILVDKGIPIIDKTSNLSNRGEEIRDYIKNNNIYSYCIIDDDIIIDVDQKHYFIHTDFNEGLTWDNISDSIKILGLKLY